MNTRFSFKTLSTHLFLVCFFFIQAWGLNIIDIEETTFSRGAIHTTEDGIKIQSPTLLRFIDFDVTNQKFEKILYVMTQKSKEYTFTYKGLTLGFQRDKKTRHLTINVESVIPREETWFEGPDGLFSKLKTKTLEQGVFRNEEGGNKSFIRPRGETFLPSQKVDLLKLFRPYQSRKKSKASPPIKARFKYAAGTLSYPITGEFGLSRVVGQGANNAEVGILGELASDLTFLPIILLRRPLN